LSGSLYICFMVGFAGKYTLPCCMILFIFFSCSRTPVPPPEMDTTSTDNGLKNSLVGMWQSDALVVGIDTINNSENSVILEVTKDQWTEKLRMQPIQTIFNSNNTYITAYTSSDGKLIKMTAGKWNMGKNQLKIHQLFPEERQMNYRIDFTAGCAELRSRLDFDNDGKEDDLFYCQMKRVG
jgi:hypothetical protein